MPARPSRPPVAAPSGFRAPPGSTAPAPEGELVAALVAAAEEVAAVAARLAPRFARREARQHAQAYLQGLLSPVERKNGWQLAEAAGDRTPYATQHLLGRADWDPDAVRDDLRAYVMEYLADPDAILVLDESAVVKKGTHSAGVAKQYAGCVGKLENAQVGVYLAYASLAGVALIDRALYVPQEWTDDRARCQAAGIPDAVAFATKPELARQMLERARAAGVCAAWVTGDSVYGDDRRLRVWLEQQEQAYVLAVSGKEYVTPDATWAPRQVKMLLTEVRAVPADAWQRLSAGDGSKGPRWYDWYRLPLVPPLQAGWERWCLVRRSVSDPSDLQAYVVFASVGTPLAELVRVAGARWTIEVAFEQAKGEVGLDQYEVRSWTGWYRHMTLALFAQAVLTVVRLHLGTRVAPGGTAAPQKGTRQQAARRAGEQGLRARRGSLARFRQQRRTQEQEERWPRRASVARSTPPTPSPSSSR